MKSWVATPRPCVIVREYLFVSFFRVCAESLASKIASPLAEM